MSNCRIAISPKASKYLRKNNVEDRFHKELRKLYEFDGDKKVVEDDLRGPLVKFQRGDYRGFWC